MAKERDVAKPDPNIIKEIRAAIRHATTAISEIERGVKMLDSILEAYISILSKNESGSPKEDACNDHRESGMK